LGQSRGFHDTFNVAGFWGFIWTNNIKPNWQGHVNTLPVASVRDGPWEQATTWLAGLTPSNKTVVYIQSSVSLTSDASAAHLIIPSPKGISTPGLSCGSSSQLSFTPSFFIQADGPWQNQGKVILPGGTVASPITFFDLVLDASQPVQFSAAGSAVQNSLKITSTGTPAAQVITGNALTYGNGASLIYAVGSAYDRGLEWITQSEGGVTGKPTNVMITQNTLLNVAGNDSPASKLYIIPGTLSIDGGSGLTMNKAGHEMTEPLIAQNLIVNNQASVTVSSVAGTGDLKVSADLKISDGALFN